MQTALVLQGGGALGAYELGVIRRLAEEAWFPPDIIAGVSIGAINAALIAGGYRGSDKRKTLEPLEKAWQQFAMAMPSGLPPKLEEAMANFGHPHFYRMRLDVAAMPSWTYLYDVEPLRGLLEGLINFPRLNSPAASTLVLTAMDVRRGELVRFYNAHHGPKNRSARDRERDLTVKHILASGALPPSFSMVNIDGRCYWDGGVFSNSPLDDAIECFADGKDDGSKAAKDKLLIVVNLFCKSSPLPTNLQEVGERFLEIIFSNKISAETGSPKKYKEFRETMDQIKKHGPEVDAKLTAARDPGWLRLKRYDHIEAIVIEPGLEAGDIMRGGHNFAADILQERAELGWDDADRKLASTSAYQEMLARHLAAAIAS